MLWFDLFSGFKEGRQMGLYMSFCSLANVKYDLVEC